MKKILITNDDGIFAEGIDLARDRLIGAVIVGTGLPQVCRERELSLIHI